MDRPRRPVARGAHELAAELGLHQLSVEDALESHQRDKYVHYDHHVFLVCHAIALDVEHAELDVVELDVFIGARWLVTVHRSGRSVMDRVAARWEQVRRSAGESVGFALYALLDIVVDGYFETLDAFERYYDDASDRVFARGARSSRRSSASGSRCAPP